MAVYMHVIAHTHARTHSHTSMLMSPGCTKSSGLVDP